MDYKSGYYLLFNKLTDIILEIESIQVQAEETVVCDDDPEIKIISTKSDLNN